jgi:hypothetical protein
MHRFLNFCYASRSQISQKLNNEGNNKGKHVDPQEL